MLFSFKYSLNMNRWEQCPLKMVHQTRSNRFTSLRNQGFVFQTKSSRQYTQEYAINYPRDTTSITFKDSKWGLRVAYQHAWHHTSTSGESHQSSKVGNVRPNSANSNLWSTCDQLVINLSDTDCPTNQTNKINNIRILTLLGLGLPEGVNQWYLEGWQGRVSRPRSTGKGGNSYCDGCDVKTLCDTESLWLLTNRKLRRRHVYCTGWWSRDAGGKTLRSPVTVGQRRSWARTQGRQLFPRCQACSLTSETG